MVLQLRTSLVWAMILYICVGTVYQIALPITEQIQHYVDFILTTDFDAEFLLKPYYAIISSLDQLDSDLLSQGLPRLETGW